ncbi:unnamed protein product [Discosporangium mesarthrocarpum]
MQDRQGVRQRHSRQARPADRASTVASSFEGATDVSNAEVRRSAAGRETVSSVKFAHNGRLWILGGPSLGVLLLLGGRPTCLVAAFGVMICYCFDLANNRDGAMGTLWTFVLLTVGTVVWAGSALGLFHLLCLAFFVFTVGAWATLQFAWVLRDDRPVAQVLERLVFACFPLLASALLAWGGIAYGGATYASPCLMLALYSSVALYGVPLNSCIGGRVFSHGDWTPPVLCGCLLFMPVLLQVSVDHRLLVFGGSEGRDRDQILARCLLALALPYPLLLTLLPRSVLWWARPALRAKLEQIVRLAGVISLFAAGECVLLTSVLPAFRPYLSVKPPQDILLGSGALFCALVAWVTSGAGQRLGQGSGQSIHVSRAMTVGAVRWVAWVVGREGW